MVYSIFPRVNGLSFPERLFRSLDYQVDDYQRQVNPFNDSVASPSREDYLSFRDGFYLGYIGGYIITTYTSFSALDKVTSVSKLIKLLPKTKLLVYAGVTSGGMLVSYYLPKVFPDNPLLLEASDTVLGLSTLVGSAVALHAVHVTVKPVGMYAVSSARKLTFWGLGRFVRVVGKLAGSPAAETGVMGELPEAVAYDIAYLSDTNPALLESGYLDEVQIKSSTLHMQGYSEPIPFEYNALQTTETAYVVGETYSYKYLNSLSNVEVRSITLLEQTSPGIVAELESTRLGRSLTRVAEVNRRSLGVGKSLRGIAEEAAAEPIVDFMYAEKRGGVWRAQVHLVEDGYTITKVDGFPLGSPQARQGLGYYNKLDRASPVLAEIGETHKTVQAYTRPLLEKPGINRVLKALFLNIGEAGNVKGVVNHLKAAWRRGIRKPSQEILELEAKLDGKTPDLVIRTSPSSNEVTLSEVKTKLPTSEEELLNLKKQLSGYVNMKDNSYVLRSGETVKVKKVELIIMEPAPVAEVETIESWGVDVINGYDMI